MGASRRTPDRYSIGEPGARPNSNAPAAPARGWHDGAVVEVSRARFEELVDDAIDQVPDELARLVSNVVVLVEEEPPAEDPDLLGVYDGLPLTERDSGYTGFLPDRILV